VSKNGFKTKFRQKIKFLKKKLSYGKKHVEFKHLFTLFLKIDEQNITPLILSSYSKMRNIGTDQSKVFEQDFTDFTSFNLLTRVDKHPTDLVSVHFHCAARNCSKLDKLGKKPNLCT
jgi:hypothetical protein